MGTKGLQAELPLNGDHGLPTRMDVEPSVIYRQPTFLAAIKLCIHYAGFDYEKEIYKSLNIDAGNWSRMMNGAAAFPPDKLIPLIDLCGNEIPLQWFAFKRGYRLEPERSEHERRIAELEAENFELKKEMGIVRKWLQGVK